MRIWGRWAENPKFEISGAGQAERSNVYRYNVVMWGGRAANPKFEIRNPKSQRCAGRKFEIRNSKSEISEVGGRKRSNVQTFNVLTL